MWDLVPIAFGDGSLCSLHLTSKCVTLLSSFPWGGLDTAWMLGREKGRSFLGDSGKHGALVDDRAGPFAEGFWPFPQGRGGLNGTHTATRRWGACCRWADPASPLSGLWATPSGRQAAPTLVLRQPAGFQPVCAFPRASGPFPRKASLSGPVTSAPVLACALCSTVGDRVGSHPRAQSAGVASNAEELQCSAELASCGFPLSHRRPSSSSRVLALIQLQSWEWRGWWARGCTGAVF